MAILPIVGRELRVAARKPLTHWLRFSAGLGLIILWTVLVVGDRGTAPTQLGHDLFVAMTIPVLGFCTFSGVFLTADALSEEKREGTLGLLFLTPLKSYDVVLGKLAATSLQAVFAIVSTLPVLALPLMLGGVTGAEFLRVMAALAATLLFSLGLGLYVSSTSYDARQALGRTLLLVLAFAGACPLIWFLHSALWRFDWPRVLLSTSPGFAFAIGLDPLHTTRGGSFEFGWSILVLAAIGASSGILACVKVRRSIGAIPSLSADRSNLRGAKRPHVHLEWENPFYWLTARQGTDRIWRKISAVAIPIWLLALLAAVLSSPSPGAPIAVLLTMALLYGLHQVLKIFMAIEATRRLSEDRHLGSLELLLVSPLSVDSILRGHVRALRGRFALPIIVLCALNILFTLGMFAVSKSDSDSQGKIAAVVTSLAGIVLLICDFRAVLWLGMWRALVSRRHHRAVLSTLLPIMGAPWFSIFLAFTGLNDLSFEAGMIAIGLWSAASIALDRLLELRAKHRLIKRFRLVAAGGG